MASLPDLIRQSMLKRGDQTALPQVRCKRMLGTTAGLSPAVTIEGLS
jgi:hypothetical protein